MKVLVDTNLLVSALLSAATPPSLVVAGAMNAMYELLVSEESITELLVKCRQKPYLAERISEATLANTVDILRVTATVLPILSIPPAAITRDPKDDYLIAHAIAEQVDVLVSGDRDLLALDGTFPFRILTPAAFAATLEADQTP